jgi:glycosyltransferase involved in cell wall biosynthesis
MIVERDFPNDDRVKKEAPSLIQEGHKVDVFCYTRTGIDRTEDYRGITVIKRRISEFTYKSSALALNMPFYFNFWERILTRHLEMNNYQVLHLHDLVLAQVVYKLSIKYNCKFVLDLHENYPALISMSTFTKKFPANILVSESKWQEYEDKYVGKADGLVTVVHEMKERITPFANCEIAVVENTINLSELVEYENRPDSQYITLIYSGGISYHRGLQYIVSGLRQAIDQNSRIRLFILGSGSYENELRQRIHDNGIEQQVIFLGMLSHEMMFRYMYESDIALIPHIKSVQTDNSSPNKLYQYMFCGKPILASNCKSIERVLTETKTGLTYLYDSPEDFKEKLMQLISEMPFDQYRINGKKALSEKYNWGQSVKELIQLYETLENRG